MRRDRRCEAEILAEARWQPLRHLTDRLGVQDLIDVDRLLKRCEAAGIAHIDDITESLIERVDPEGASATYLRRLARALATLLPGTALAARAAAVAGRRQRAWKSTRSQAKTGRVYLATKTILEENLPAAWRRALADMRAGFGSNTGRAPAPKITETIAMKLRQLAKSAQDAGLQADLTLDTLTALHSDGLDPAYLEPARDDCLSRKRPVLITRTGTGVGYNYVSDVWRAHFGTGEHITRTEVHETFAEARGAVGTELALAQCGQTSPATAEHYHGKRLQRRRLAKMQNGMLKLAEELPDDLFAVD